MLTDIHDFYETSHGFESENMMVDFNLSSLECLEKRLKRKSISILMSCLLSR